MTVFWGDCCEEDEIINEEEVSESRTISRGFDAFPIIDWNFFLNEPDKVFHAENEDVGGGGSPCLIPLEGWKGSKQSPLRRIERLEEEMQDMMSEIQSGGNLK